MSFFNHPMFSFLKNGIQTPVSKDTVTPANSTPLPVELTGASGDVAINAANLHMEVQLSDQGTDPDVTRIGDGTNQLAINADGSINVKFDGSALSDTFTILDSIVLEEDSELIVSGAAYINIVETDSGSGRATINGVTEYYL